jgi:[protein-PII] uridylyltransferase
MPTLIEKIEADAAARLVVPPGRTGAQELARFKTFLKLETHRLKMAHRAGGGGREICQARAVVLDLILRGLWTAARNSLTAQAQREFPPLALVALGGYGRGELNPHSDIDLMFLHDGQVVAHQTRPLPHLEKLMDGVLLPLWDLGLKLGHSVRTVGDCVEMANLRNDPRSMETKTSLIEARLVAGDAKLFAQLEKTVAAKCIARREDEYIQARLADQVTRHGKFGDSASMQEPNIKSGCGGLRDVQSLLWMALFRYRTRSLRELEERELISHAEALQIEAAYDYLLRVRNELHYHSNRATDALTKSLQPAVARQFGFKDASPSRRIEKFMRELYGHTRNIYLITRTLEQRLALLPQPGRRPSLLQFWRRAAPKPAGEPVDGFLFVDQQVLQASNRIFRDQPRRLMRAFLHAQQRGLKLHPDLAQLIRNQLDLVDRDFLRDEHVRESFLTILNQRGNVGAVLRDMHDVGLLGRYVPEFGKLACLVQHEFYHQYTADEHTVQCLEQVDRVWEAKHPPYSPYAPLLQGLERPFLLYLALLLHDVGKAQDHHDHAKASSAMARRAARRLALDPAAIDTLCRVIENHLLAARTCQLRDLDDPGVIRAFARTMQSTEMLNLLTLHTFADSQATSDKLWTGFKDALLWSLHRKTIAVLTGGTEFIRAGELEREKLMAQVRELLEPPLTREELEAHFAHLPQRYFEANSAREILEDIKVSHQFMELLVLAADRGLEPAIRWQPLPDRACDAVKISTWDRAGLFGKIAGCFSATGFNILSAQIFTRADGIALDTFAVTNAQTGALADREQRARFNELLIQALSGKALDLRALISRQRGIRPLYQSYEGERLPTRVTFDNSVSESRTVIEIETEDRIGLLFAISQTLAELGLDISTAKVCTEKGAAIDSFYVSDLVGNKVTDAERLKLVERELQHAIYSLDASPR